MLPGKDWKDFQSCFGLYDGDSAHCSVSFGFGFRLLLPTKLDTKSLTMKRSWPTYYIQMIWEGVLYWAFMALSKLDPISSYLKKWWLLCRWHFLNEVGADGIVLLILIGRRVRPPYPAWWKKASHRDLEVTKWWLYSLVCGGVRKSINWPGNCCQPVPYYATH
jgi:hypothetical protein